MAGLRCLIRPILHREYSDYTSYRHDGHDYATSNSCRYVGVHLLNPTYIHAFHSSAAHHIQTSTIVGAIIGGIGGLALFVMGVLLYCRRRRNIERRSSLQQNTLRAAPYLTPSSIDRGTRHDTGSNGGIKTLGIPHQTLEVTSATSTPALPFDSSWSIPARAVTLPQLTNSGQSSGLGSAIRGEGSQDSPSHVIVPVRSRPITRPTNLQKGHRDTPPPAYRQVYPGSSILSS